MPRPLHPFTTHGISRAGDEYQDLWGIELLLEWLEHPGRYDWVRFECDDVGALDDVVARRSGGGLVCRQMKHTPEPERPDLAASWDWLTYQKPGQNGPLRSLLQHWADALDRELDGESIGDAGLFTNRRPDRDVSAARIGKRIDFDRIPDPAIQRIITDQLGGADRARAFFQRFDFNLDLPSYDVFEQFLKERFRRSVGGDDEGWGSLRAATRDWALRKDRAGPGGRITLQDVRRAALWHQPHALSQDFAVPDDYVVPDPDMRDALVAELRAPGNGTIVIAAGPGFGKSTFLSHLTGHLAGQGVPAIRHHYYMAARERAEDRFSHGVVLEALMAQLLRHYAALLGTLADRNPAVSDFGRWLAAAGKAASDRHTPLVVIIDGLDHVWREQGAATELERLFTQLLPPPAGVRLVIGTQPLEDGLPPILLRYARRDTWRTLPPLGIGAILALLRRNRDRFCRVAQGTDLDHHLADAAVAFHQLTGGYPLHLRYSLEALIARGSPPFTWEITSLPPCPEGQITHYYDALCLDLDETACRQLHLFAVTGFPWPKKALLQVLDPSGVRRPETQAALRSIRHLFEDTPLGLVPFHASLIHHLRHAPGYEEDREELLEQVAGWLDGLAPEPWRWAYRWLVAADRGQPGELVAGPNDAWLADAIAKRRPGALIDRILSRASHHALRVGDLPRTVELGLLAHYARQSRESFIYDLTPLTACALKTERRLGLIQEMRSDISKLPAPEMVALVAGGEEEGDQDLAEACLTELQIRLENLEDRSYSSREEWNQNMLAVPWLLGYLRRTLTKHDVAAIQHTAIEGGPGFQAFLAARAEIHHWTDIPNVITLVTSQTDCHDMAVGAFRYASPAGIDWLCWNDRDSWRLGPMALAARMVRGETPDPLSSSLVPWPAPASKHHPIVVGPRRTIVLDLHRIFFANLVHAWLNAPLPAPDHWGVPDRCAMAAAGQEIGRQLASGMGIKLAEAFRTLPHGERQAGEDFWDAHRRARDVHRADIEIFLDLAVLRGLIGGECQISASDLIPLIDAAGRWCRDLRDAVIDSRLVILSPDAVAKVVEHEVTRMSREVEELHDRFEDYARLAWLVCRHDPGDPENSVLTTRAAHCAIGYGHHKDLLLSETMSAIKAVADTMPGPAMGWMQRMAPFVDAVTEFTDGDETKHHKVTMGALLLRLAPDLVPAYIRHLAARGDRHWADHVTALYVASADLEAEEVQALMRIAGGEATFKALSERTAQERRVIQGPGGTTPTAISGSTQPEDCTTSATGTEPPLELDAFPPERFEAFRHAAIQRVSGGERLVLDWFRHWSAQDRDGTLEALARATDTDLYPTDMQAVLMEAFQAVLPVTGREAGFDWLVRAHRAAMAWTFWWYPEEKARTVWTELRRTYPDHWHDFVQATASFGGNAEDSAVFIGRSRLVSFLMQLDQTELAVTVTERLVEVLLRRAADLPLRAPAWTEGFDA